MDTLASSLTDLFTELLPDTPYELGDVSSILLPFYIDELITKSLSAPTDTPRDAFQFKPIRFNGDIKLGYFDRVFHFTNLFAAVISSHGFQTGKYCFQTLLLTPGLQQVGITSRTDQFNTTLGVGDFPYSYAFDGSRQCYWHGESVPVGRKWAKGDVVTTCVDLDERRVMWYLNSDLVGDGFFGIYADQDPAPPVFFGVSASAGQSCIINFGEFPFFFAEHFEDYRTVAPRPTPEIIQECSVLQRAIVHTLRSTSNASVQIFTALLTRYFPLIVNSRYLCATSFSDLLTECKELGLLPRFGILLKHHVLQSDLSIVFETLMEFYYMVTKHFPYDDQFVVDLTKLILDVLTEMMIITCKDSPKLLDFIVQVLTNSGTTVTHDEFMHVAQDVDLTSPPTQLVETLNKRHADQLERDTRLLTLLETAGLLPRFILFHTETYSVMPSDLTREDGVVAVSLRISFALFNVLLRRKPHLVLSSRFFRESSTVFADTDRLGGLVTYLTKTFVLEDNDGDYEETIFLHHLMVFFYNEVSLLFDKTDALARIGINQKSALKDRKDWLHYFWRVSGYVVPAHYNLIIGIFQLLVNALLNTPALLYIHEFYIPCIFSLLTLLLNNTVFESQRVAFEQVRPSVLSFLDFLIGLLLNPNIVKPSLNMSIFTFLGSVLTKIPTLLLDLPYQSVTNLLTYLFQTVLLTEDEVVPKALTFIRNAFPIPFYNVSGPMAIQHASAEILRKVFMSYLATPETACAAATALLDNISRSFDRALLTLDKDRLTEEEEMTFNTTKTNLMICIDALSAMAAVRPEIYREHTMATKFLRLLSFVLYQCSVRTQKSSMRKRVIAAMFDSLRLFVLYHLSNVLQLFDGEEKQNWLLQDGIITSQLAGSVNGVTVNKHAVFFFTIDLPFAVWDLWTPRQNGKVFAEEHEKQRDLVFDTINETLHFLQDLFETLSQKKHTTVEVVPEVNGKSTNSTFVIEVPEDEDKLCFICCSNPADTIFLPCKHSACRGCITRYLEQHTKCFFCMCTIEELKERAEMGMESESATHNL